MLIPCSLKQNSLSPSTEVGIAITLHQCSGTCDTSGNVLGEVLYSGAWNPQYGKPSEAAGVPYQNFTLTVPSSYSGDATLFLVHTNLIGVSSECFHVLVIESRGADLNCACLFRLARLLTPRSSLNR